MTGGKGKTMKKAEPTKWVQYKYYYKGEFYTAACKVEEAIDRFESLTNSGAKIWQIDQFTIG